MPTITENSIDATITRILFHKTSSYDPAGVPFAILKLSTGIVAKGQMREPIVGSQYRFFGSFQPQKGGYPDAFEFHSHEALCDQSVSGVEDYLNAHIRKIGRVKAKAIVAAFGDETLTILRTTPERALEVEGINEAIVESIKAHFADNRKFDPVAYSKLIDMFKDHRISKKVIELLLKAFGSDAPAKVLANPYLLLQYPRVGWKTADGFALGQPPKGAGYDPSGRERHESAVMEALEQIALDGHTCGTQAEVLRTAEKLLGETLADGTLANLVAKRDIIEGDDGEGTIYQLTSLAAAEAKIAEKLQELATAGRPLPKIVTEAWAQSTGLGPDQVQAARLIEENAVCIITGAPGVGKAQPLDSPILTPNGWVKMGDIATGNRVIGRDGKDHIVTGVYPQGELDVFRVTFSDGSSTECCGNHLWKVLDRDRRSKPGKPARWFVLSTNELIASGLTSGDNHDRWTIPMVAPIDLNSDEPLPIHPYVVGAFLGDGCFRGTGSITFASRDDEIIDRIRSLLPDDCELVRRDYCDNRCDFSIRSRSREGRNEPSLLRWIRATGLWGKMSHDKWIPESYMFASLEDRIELLRGLLDTDGYSDEHRIEFATTSPQLRDGVIWLTESIGGTVNVTERHATYTYRGEKRTGRLSWRIHLRLPTGIMPFHLKRKKDRYVRTKYQPRRAIISIEPVGRKQCQCISVSADDQLYITDRCIVTHNTYVISRIIKAMQAAGVVGIRCCAPTGKASKRLAELLATAGVEGVPSTTIHKALKPVPSVAAEGVPADDARFGRGREAFGFGRNEGNPLEDRIVIVDETSMVDCRLMSSLLRAIKPGTRVIFVGDHNQLPSVGPGSTLRDMIAAGIPTAELTEIRRSDGGGTIVKACHAIKDGIVPRDAERINLPTDNWIHIEIEDPREIAAKIVELHATTKKFDPMWDMQVVSPQKGKLPIGCENLNRLLSRQINPAAHYDDQVSNGDPNITEREPQFKVGDKVVRTKNEAVDALIPWEDRAKHAESDPEVMDKSRPDMEWRGQKYVAVTTAVVNGDMGTVEDIIEGANASVIVRFRDPERLVRLPYGEAHLLMAYAMTVHKCQGSGMPYVIIPVHNSYYYDQKTGQGLWMRELVYTAISRAEQLLVTVGTWSSLVAAIGRKTVQRRQTTLEQRITGIYGETTPPDPEPPTTEPDLTPEPPSPPEAAPEASAAPSDSSEPPKGEERSDETEGHHNATSDIAVESPTLAPPWIERSSAMHTMSHWSIEKRERWGRRSNELEDAGVAFPESERRAYEEVRSS